MAEVGLDVANVAGVEIVRHRSWPGVKHRHLRRPFDIVLPLVGVRMPVHLTHAPWMDSDECRGDGGGSLEIMAVSDLGHTALGLPGHRSPRKRIGEWVRRRTVRA